MGTAPFLPLWSIMEFLYHITSLCPGLTSWSSEALITFCSPASISGSWGAFSRWTPLLYRTLKVGEVQAYLMMTHYPGSPVSLSVTDHHLKWRKMERKVSDQIRSVTQSCPTFCDPMNCSMPGLPVHHHLPEITQTHIHLVDDAIQPSHPLSSPFPPAPNPSQHQSLFQWVNSLHEVAKVLEFQL